MEMLLVLTLVAVCAAIYVVLVNVQLFEKQQSAVFAETASIKERLKLELEYIRTRQSEIDKVLDDQAERIKRREAELQRWVDDMVQQGNKAIEQYVGPYKEFHEEVEDGNGVRAIDQALEELDTEDLEKAYRQWEAGLVNVRK